MFKGCKSLTSLEISSFNTSSVDCMCFMFSGCSSLKELNLNSFNTIKVKNMNNMFEQCESLISLDLSNFDISKYASMNSMFYNSNSLIYLNLANFTYDSSLIENFLNNLYNLNKNITICINDTSIINKLNSVNYKVDCQNICFDDEKKLL